MTIYTALDIPNQNQVIPAGGFYVAGWVFNCEDGSVPQALNVSLYNYDTQAWWKPDHIQLYDHLPRPDVMTAMQGTCPAVSPYTGYHAYVTPQPPPGHYAVWVTWANAIGNQAATTKDITIQ